MLASAVMALIAFSCTRPDTTPAPSGNEQEVPADEPTDEPGDTPGDAPGDNPGEDPGENPGEGPGDEPGETTGEWDGKTFTDRSAEWQMAFTDHGKWWSFDIITCTAPYHLIKYVQEGDTALGFPAEICRPDPDIARAYRFFCVDVDESYLLDAVSTTLPDEEELLWPDGAGRAHGFVFGFDANKKFTGEYAHLASEKVF